MCHGGGRRRRWRCNGSRFGDTRRRGRIGPDVRHGQQSARRSACRTLRTTVDMRADNLLAHSEQPRNAFCAVRMTGMELVRHSGHDWLASCEQDLAYNAEGARRYPYFFPALDFVLTRFPDANRNPIRSITL
ncbi:hypothetical protein BJA5080_06696 [Bradyrhizobium diazoefficiens SEMIA 5080]|uniref:Uncharacterized protein n=1 Tax=Bradyrhizobium diazoefficiens SEMIA 5080 TaxID=754504 RepID=A0A837CPU6_9BRAD|nr:hypothetical protein BJA5080_06696 [Bradyrhizobium diazoefficiens SEMIA 5080]